MIKKIMPAIRAAMLAALVTAYGSASANTYPVTTNADAGAGSLREAITLANGNSGADVITFSGTYNITLLSQLPAITGAVTIDGTLTPGYIATPLITIDGSDLLAIGLDVQASNVSINAITITRFSTTAIQLANTNALVRYCILDDNANGIYITGANNTIGGSGAGNIIIRNDQNGIYIDGVTGNIIKGNHIGTDATGNNPFGNGVGVYINGESNTVGGTAAGEGNTISANVDGVYINQDNNTITGNYIGVNTAGTAMLGNSDNGIEVNSDLNVIGGTTAGSGNVISGNSANGIAINNGSDNTVYGNTIGLNAAGTAAIGNFGTGIYIADVQNVIGGNTANARNIISGNSLNGISVANDDNEIYGNYIGTDVTGAVALGNGAPGILIDGSANGTVIGGSGTGEGNVIAANGIGGIYLNTGTGTLIKGNIIGMNATGTAALGNASVGVLLLTGGNTVGDGTAGGTNYISGNVGDGIIINGGVSSNTINGNYIGTDVAGSAAIANTGRGIYIQSGTNTAVSNNVISGNTGVGVQVAVGTGNTFYGNKIGTNATATAALANAGGITIASASNIIGSSSAAQRNIISGNNGAGITVTAGTGNMIKGNYIGLNTTGTVGIGNTGNGITISGGGAQVGGSVSGEGNVISGNTVDGVEINVASQIIQGNTIGMNATGTAAIANGGYGIELNGNSNTVGGNSATTRNYLSGNTLTGITVTSGAGNIIKGNYIGTSMSGTVAVANANVGIYINGGSATEIGGSVSGEGNLVSGNTLYGLHIASGTGHIVRGNTVGMNAAGTAAIANGSEGIRVSTASNTIGGSTTSERNYISGNTGIGIHLTGSSNTIKGNYIGVNAAGTAAVGNTSAGIYIEASTNQIGGTGANDGNVISGNQRGIYMQNVGGSNIVEGNIVGMNAAGTAAIPNTLGGIGMITPGNIIGGSAAGAANYVSGNANLGISIFNTSNCVVKGNYVGLNKAGTAAVPNTGPAITVQGAGTGNVVGGTAAGEGNIVSGNTSVTAILLAGSAAVGVYGNIVGLNPAGTAAIPNGTGVLISGTNQVLGGSGAGERNYISGNSVVGVAVNGTSNAVKGNYIGLDITGAIAIANGAGIVLSSSSNTIGGSAAGEGNVISGNTGGTGISITSGADNNVIKGNYIGTNAAGTIARPNGVSGISITGNSTVIGGSAAGERNLISGNTSNGIAINVGVTGTIIKGNYLGTDITGTLSIPNTLNGINISGTSTTVGGDATAGEGNLISGNTMNGVTIPSGGTGNVIKGNYIGTDRTGTADLGNGQSGINISAASNTVGGSGTGEGNVISGNNASGIIVTSTGSLATIKGNLIGTDRSGTIAIANSQQGISLSGISNTIGGSAAGERNIISGNTQNGVFTNSASTGNIIRGNYIGTDITGTADLGNASAGLSISGASNTIGGANAGEGNVISGNNTGGMTASSTASVTVVQGNYIGTDRSGTVTLSNTGGSGINMGSANSIIGGSTAGERNVISGNAQAGITISGANNTVKGNYLGTDVTGTVDLGNGQQGVALTGPFNTVGGSAAGEGNLISGNNGGGISTSSSASVTVIQGNYIGTDRSGTVAIGNTSIGISIATAGNTIGGNSTIGQGNLISGNTTTGITITTTGFNNVIKGNYIGTDVTGTADLGNTSTGISVTGPFTTIGGIGTGERNIISGNNGGGIAATLSASVTVIKGNYIGTDRTGTVALGNTTVGISASTAGNVIGGNSTIGEGNLISANSTNGITLSAGANNNIIRGNYIGTDVTGTADLGNTQGGVSVATASVTIGGTGIGEGNLISGNNGGGIGLTSTSSGAVLRGNYVGTDKSGTAMLGNTGVGVTLNGTGHILGGSSAAERNLVSGNSANGVNIDGASNTVQGNYIGTDVTGTLDFGNGGGGVFINGASNVIGGSIAGQGNLISGNSSGGISAVATASLTVIKGNYVGTDVSGTVAIGNTINGISVAGPNTTIGGSAAGEGNLVSGNSQVGINISSGSGDVVKGNYVGTNVAGTAAIANGGSGMNVNGTNHVIGGSTAGDRNLLSGNVSNGILLGGANLILKGNYIGTNIAGTAALPNGFNGVRVQNPSCTIGGSAAGEGNLISGNATAGISCVQSGSLTVIKGNYVGTDKNGTSVIANVGTGIDVATAGNTIGGSLAGERNLVSGNGSIGISISSSGNTVKGNYVGTDITGSLDLGNGDGGVTVTGSNNVVGGNALAGEGNLFSGNTQNGMFSSGTNNTFKGNYVGTNAAGTAAISNGFNGVRIQGSDNIVGGSGAGEGNLISGNATAGISCVLSGSLTVIKGNYIGTDKNGTLAIANGNTGIDMSTAGNTIGGSLAGERNIISGNTSHGINVGSASNTIKGNYIGTDVTGTISLGNTGAGISGSGSSNTIGGSTAGEGNVVSGNSGNGVSLTGSSNVLMGNIIGMNAAGSAAVPNGGVGLFSGGANTTIGGTAAGAGNLVSGNANIGVQISATGNVIQGNTIGMDITGTVAMPNSNGIVLASGANTIGGSAAGARNYISGNTNYGISIQNSANGSIVQGNILGMNAAGTAAVPNVMGLFISAGTNTIGGTAAGEGNFISGNSFNGVNIQGTSTGNILQGNIIGLNLAGTAAVPNAVSGIAIVAGAHTIGGSAAGVRNYISGNVSHGISLTSGSNTVKGNYIGTDITGTLTLGNGGSGINITAGSNTIGGTVAGEGNVITGSGLQGINITGSVTGNKLSGNSIYNNGSLGIDLNDDGVTLNDALDADGGPNGRMNFPVITSITQAGGNTTILGTFSGAASAAINVELFNNAVKDQSGYGEGQTYLGTVIVNTNVSGQGTFSTSVVGNYSLITATATNATNNTSEFSYTGPTFTNASPQSFRICQNAPAASVKSVLLVNDPQIGETITWYAASAPTSGTLTVTGATAASGSASVTPGGTISYAPTAGYSGADAFTIGATDGTSTVTMVVNVTVDPLPVVNTISNNGPVCANTTLSFSAAASGGTGALGYAWSGPLSFSATGQTPSIATATVTATGIYTVIVTDAQSCVTTATTTATVHALPDITAIGATTPVCEFQPLSLNTTVSGGTGPYNYNWSGPNSFASTLEDPLVTSSASVLNDGVYTLTATDANSCSAIGTNTTTVVVYPILPISGPTSVLFGQNITLSYGASGGSWSTPTPWTTGVNASTGVVKGVSAGTSVISYTTAQGCVATYTVAVLSGINACQGQGMTLSDGGNPGGTWTSANGSIATVGLTTGIVTGVNPGTVAITYRVSAAAPLTYTVTVNPLRASSSSVTQVCQGQAIVLANGTPGGGTWYSGNTNTAIVSSGGVVTGVGGGTVVIYFTPLPGCVTTRTVTVNPVAPITGTLTVCVGQTTSVNVSQTGGYWSTSSGSLANVNSTGVITGVSAGYPRVSYIWPTGCFSTATVTVYPLSPNNTLSNYKVCEGFSITYTNATPVPGVWTTSNTNLATISSSGVLTGVMSGVAIVSYTTSQGCIATRSTTVNALPSVSGVRFVCVGQTTMLSGDLPGGTWSTSTGVASVNSVGLVKGVSAGNTRISYILPTGCYDYADVTVNALSQITGGTSGMCASGSMTLVNNTPGGGVWSSSNSSAATVNASGVVRGSSAGTTVISFSTNSAGCVATKTITVNACRQSGGSTSVDGFTEELGDIQLFPNPNNGTFTLIGGIDVYGGDVVIDVVDMLGKSVFHGSVTVYDGRLEKQITLPDNLANGTYMLRLMATDVQKIYHFVVNH